ncbi:MAG: hypothetical protein KDD62_15445, partial [Bdellovibrionales bacterium]|nr:hypothetical protein [Bdellovibrionales bacterium]
MANRIVLLIGTLLLAFPLNAISQTDDCSDSTAISVQSVLTAAAADACSLSGNAQKKRINKQIKKLKNSGVTRALGKTFVNSVVAELNEMKTSSCSDQTSEDACTSELAITPTEVEANLVEQSCGDKFKTKRRRELTATKKAIKSTVIDATFVSTTESAVDSLLASEDCGQGGEESASKCQKSRKVVDGFGDWLHKPVADHNPSFVNLLPAGDRASSCVYETKAGKKLYSAEYTGIANGNRQHFRPSGL